MSSLLGINPKLTTKNINMGTKPKKSIAFGRDYGNEIFKEIKKEVDFGRKIKNETITKRLKGHFGFSRKKIIDFVEIINDRTTTMLIQLRGLRKALKEASEIIAQFPEEKAQAVEKAKKDSADYYSKIIAEKDKEILEAKTHKQSSQVGQSPSKQ